MREKGIFHKGKNAPRFSPALRLDGQSNPLKEEEEEGVNGVDISLRDRAAATIAEGKRVTSYLFPSGTSQTTPCISIQLKV